jgi:hypothetical protein
MNGRADRHDEANSRFSQFCERDQKGKSVSNFFHRMYVVALYTYKYMCICVCTHTHTHTHTHTNKVSSSEDCTMSTPDSILLATYHEGYQIEDRGMGE